MEGILEFADTAEVPELTEPLPDEPSGLCEGCERALADYATALETLTQNQERMTDRMDAVIKGYNIIGTQVQNITNGFGALFQFFTSIQADLGNMSFPDKIKILRELMSNNGN